jgi:hypothetical protein
MSSKRTFAEELEAFLQEVKGWKPAVDDGDLAQKRIEWLDIVSADMTLIWSEH